MANPDHVNIVLKGSLSIAAWRENNPETLLNLAGANLAGADFSYCVFGPVLFAQAELEGANFEHTVLTHASFIKAKLNKCNFSYADISHALILGCDCEDIIFNKANLTGSEFDMCKLQGMKIDLANLRISVFRNIVFDEISFGGLEMEEATFSKCDLKLCDFSNSVLYKSNFSDCDLSGANFKKAYLLNTIFRNSVLTGADLSDCNLAYGQISHCVMNYTKFDGALLDKAAFEQVNLYNASIVGAFLSKTIFIKVYLVKTDFSNSILTAVDFSMEDISQANFYNTINEKRENQSKSETIDTTEVDSDIRMMAAPLESFKVPNILYHTGEPETPNFITVKVYYGTDRAKEKKEGGELHYGSERGEGLTLGFCELSIPRDHRMATLEGPSMFRLQFKPYPDKHVVLISTIETEAQQFIRDLKMRINFSGKAQAFIFIHGFDISFEDAARRTAQIHYDLLFDGAPIFYSWPSEASLIDYTVDEGTMERVEKYLEAFIKMIVAQTNAKLVHIIAHSMGNRVILRVLKSLAKQSDLNNPSLKNVIFSAPDVDREFFINSLQEISRTSDHLTLYASSNDKALKASRKLHKYPRAGQAGKLIVINEAIDTIDASNLETDFLAHSYFADQKSVLADIRSLLMEDLPPAKRFGLNRVQTTSGAYWEFRLGM